MVEPYFFYQTGIDGTSTGSTSFESYDPRDSKFIPSALVITLTDVSSLVLAPTITVGTNSTSYNNVLPATLLTGLTAVDEARNIYITSSINLPASIGTGGIYVKVTTAAVASSFTFNIGILGYYNE